MNGEKEWKGGGCSAPSVSCVITASAVGLSNSCWCLHRSGYYSLMTSCKCYDVDLHDVPTTNSASGEGTVQMPGYL